MNMIAQENTNIEKDSIKSKKYFNALDYSMQKRYRPENHKFINEKWSDNTFYEIKAGAENFIHREGAEIGYFKNFMLGYGKMFTPNQSLRANILGGYAQHKRTNDSYIRVGLQMSHLFNISSYILGYNPERIFEVSTIAGLGYTYSKMMNNDAYHIGNIHAGVQVKLNIMPRLDLVAEPLIGINTDGVDHYTKTNWHKYDIGYGMSLGFKYNLNGFTDYKKQEDKNNNMFVSLSGGIQYQYSDIVKSMGLMKTVGPHVNLSFGKWLIPFLGVRFSAFYSSDIWNRFYIYDENSIPVDEKNLKCTYIGTRLEAMVNVFKFNDMDINRYMSLSPLIGIEFGGMIKKDVTRNVNSAYYAFTCGLQTKYNANERWGIFIEPRFSLVPYSYVFSNEDGTVLNNRNKYSDNIYNFNVGIEYSF